MLGMVWTADGFGSDCVGLDLTMDWFGDSSMLYLIDSSRYLIGAYISARIYRNLLDV